MTHATVMDPSTPPGSGPLAHLAESEIRYLLRGFPGSAISGALALRTGGGAALVMESSHSAARRGAVPHAKLQFVLNNSSGFGGANVCQLFAAANHNKQLISN